MLGTGPSAMETLPQARPCQSPENAYSLTSERIPNVTRCALPSLSKCWQLKHLSLDVSVPHSDSRGHQQSAVWDFCGRRGSVGVLNRKSPVTGISLGKTYIIPGGWEEAGLVSLETRNDLIRCWDAVSKGLLAYSSIISAFPFWHF